MIDRGHFPEYLEAEDDGWPWQLKAFLAMAIMLALEIVAIALLSITS